MDLWTGLRTDIAVAIASEWLEFNALVRLDNACCSHASRTSLERCLERVIIKEYMDIGCCVDMIKWFVTRKLRTETCDIDIGCAEDVSESNDVGMFFRHSGQHIRHLSLIDSTGNGLRIACDVAKYCTNLRGLVISDGVSEAAVTMILSSCPHLSVLTFSDNATSAMLEVVGKFCPDIKELAINSDPEIKSGNLDAGLLAVAEGCPGLTHLFCRQSNSITAAGIANAVVHWPHLFQLTMRTLDGRTARTIAASCPKLDVLEAVNCTHLTDADVLVLAKDSQITYLYLGRCPLLTGAAIRSFTKLRSLDLSQNHNIDNDEVMALLAHFPHLTELSLWNCSRLDANLVLPVLERGEHLTSLSLSNGADPAVIGVSAMSRLVERMVRRHYPRIGNVRLFFANPPAPA